MFEENLRAIMEAQVTKGFDAVILTSPQNRFYATGFRSSAGVALISKKRAVFATDFRYIEAAGAKINGLEVVMTSADRRYNEIINDFIAQEGVKTLAFEGDAVNFTQYAGYRDNLKAELVPEDGMMAALRQIKRPFEIERIVAAQRIAEGAFLRLLPSLKPGVSERDIAAELDYQMRRGGADGNSFDTIAVSGANSSMPHGVPGERLLAPGDFLTLDFGASSGGYSSDMTRTVAVGYVTDEMRRVYETVLAAQEAALLMARSGVTGSGLHAAAADVIAAAGYGGYFGHGLGHGLGIDVHDGAGASPGNPEPLPEGMVVTIEPGIYLPGKFGVRIEDFVVLEKDGCRNMVNTPKELLIL